jgi:hypothetical protein
MNGKTGWVGVIIGIDRGNVSGEVEVGLLILNLIERPPRDLAIQAQLSRNIRVSMGVELLIYRHPRNIDEVPPELVARRTVGSALTITAENEIVQHLGIN